MSGEGIGLDVYQATSSVAVLDSQGKLIVESILETPKESVLVPSDQGRAVRKTGRR